jgi:hypothetical protein
VRARVCVYLCVCARVRVLVCVRVCVLTVLDTHLAWCTSQELFAHSCAGGVCWVCEFVSDGIQFIVCTDVLVPRACLRAEAVVGVFWRRSIRFVPV